MKPLYGLMNAVSTQVFDRFALSLKRRAENGLQSPSPPEAEFLRWVQGRLRRARQYYRALEAVERRILELSISLGRKGAIRFVSPLLLRVLARIVAKVEHLLKGSAGRMVEEGRPIAERLSALAYSWGNRAALRWRLDHSFALYLGVLKSSMQAYCWPLSAL